MFDPADLNPDDRVLLLGIPRPEVIGAVAERLARGILVALGEPDAIREARKAARHLENVMFVPGTPEEIPWDDGFFTCVVDLVGDWSCPERVRSEVERVSAPRRAE